jgi:glycogen(starch) synthase
MRTPCLLPRRRVLTTVRVAWRAAVRVLILSWEYPPIVEGGLARHVRKLSEALVASGVVVDVVTRGGGRLSASEDRHGVTVHRVREPDFPRHDLDAFIAWVERMNADMLAAALELDGEFDLVHSHDWLVADAAGRLARRFGVPWLVTVHATEYGRHQGWVERHPQSHIHASERRMVRAADHVITCSAYMREHVADVFGVPAARVTAIPNGIDPTDLQPVEDLPRLRAQFAAPDEKLVLLVGRLVYEKGFHLARLVALEAMASGCPCIVADTGGLREVVPGGRRGACASGRATRARWRAWPSSS